MARRGRLPGPPRPPARGPRGPGGRLPQGDGPAARGPILLGRGPWPRTSSDGSATSPCWPSASRPPPGWPAGAAGTSPGPSFVVAGLLLLASTVAAFSYRQKVLALREIRESEASRGGDPDRERAGRGPARGRGGQPAGQDQGLLRPARPRPRGPILGPARLDRRRDGRAGRRRRARRRLGRPRAFRDEAIAALSTVDLRRSRAIDPKIESTIAPTIAVSPDGRRAVAFSHRPFWHRDYIGRVIDLVTGSTARTIDFRPGSPGPCKSPEEICDAAFSPDGRLLAAATSDGRAHLWDLDRPESSSFFWDASEQRIDSVAFAADGRSVYTRLGGREAPPLAAGRRPGVRPARRGRLGADRAGTPGACGRSACPRSTPSGAGLLVRHDPETLRELGSHEIGDGLRRAHPRLPLARRPVPRLRQRRGRRPAPDRGGPPRMLEGGRIAPRSGGIHYVLRFSPDGSLLMASFSDYSGRLRGLKLWEVGSGRLACTSRSTGSIGSARRSRPTAAASWWSRTASSCEYEVNGLDVQPRLAHAARPDPRDRPGPDGSTLATPGPDSGRRRPGAGGGDPLEAPRRGPMGRAIRPRRLEARRPHRPAFAGLRRRGPSARRGHRRLADPLLGPQRPGQALGHRGDRRASARSWPSPGAVAGSGGSWAARGRPIA